MRVRALPALLVAAVLAGCAGLPESSAPGPLEPFPRAKSGGVYVVGEPYRVAGRLYVPKVEYDYDRTGEASWYSDSLQGRPTANGERYDRNELTAAHPTLPLPSIVRVTNQNNGRSLVLRVNDRGPFTPGRILDVSRKAAQLLGFHQSGTTRVRVQVLEAESHQAAAELGWKG